MLASKIAESHGLQLFHIEFRKQGRRWVLRLYIDKEGGVTLDDCEKVSSQLSTELDVENFIQHSYTLEVSSPGLDRPLLSENDYLKHSGKLVKIKTHEPIDGQRNFKGKLMGYSDGMVVLEVDVRKDETRRLLIPYASIASARLEIEI